MASRFSISGKPFSWFANDRLLAVFSTWHRGREECKAFNFLQGHWSHDETSALMNSSSPKYSQEPQLQILLDLGLGLQETHGFWEDTNVQSKAGRMLYLHSFSDDHLSSWILSFQYKFHFVLAEGWWNRWENLVMFFFFSSHFNLDLLILFQKKIVSDEIFQLLWTNCFLRKLET